MKVTISYSIADDPVERRSVREQLDSNRRSRISLSAPTPMLASSGEYRQMVKF